MKYLKVFGITVFSFLLFSGCSKKAYAQGIVKESDNSIQEEITISKASPIDKVESVYEKMGARFKTEVHLENKTEFYEDLIRVLEEEKKINQNDLPLFFLIDKKHYAPEGYAPEVVKLIDKTDYNFWREDLSLRPEAEAALRVMGKAAKADGITLLVSSTYRSYEYQKALFQRWVDIDGLEEAERESARAGTSQHQLGFAVDFGSIDDSFAETKMGKWMYEHAAEYGWSLSFPKEYEDITGYRWESWHFRYIGIEACKFQKKYFNDVQQYMLEYIDAWKNESKVE